MVGRTSAKGEITRSNQHSGAGQRVRVCRSSLSGPATTGEFEIMGSYLAEGHEHMYRLRSVQGRTERVVPESELRGPKSSRGMSD
jgi:hypothetical protein